MEPRDSSRLLVLDRATGRVEHRQFADILGLLPSGAVLVLNRSRVIPARLYGRRKGTGGRVELLLLRRDEEGIWEALGKPGRSLRPGSVIRLEPPALSRQEGDSAAPAAPGLTIRSLWRPR